MSFLTENTIIKNLDWFIWERPESAHIYCDGSLTPLTDEQKHSVVGEDLQEPTTLKIRVPLSRYERKVSSIIIDFPCTVMDLLHKIHTFYMKLLSINGLMKIIGNGESISSYEKDALKRFQHGNQVRLYELLGSNTIGPDCLLASEMPASQRRHPLFCNGRVRFEGFSISKHGNIRLLLGS